MPDSSNDSSTAASFAGLAESLGQLARELSRQSDVRETLQAMTAGAVDTVTGADYAGISLVVERRKVESVAATDPLVEQADRAQDEFGEGPCLDTIWHEDTVRVGDMQDESRWPRFAPRAVELGVRSMMSFQLFTDDRNLGALNLYSRQPDAFDEESDQAGRLFAVHAAVALRGAQSEEQFNSALQNRDLIGQAKGILVERHGITSGQAFDLLVRTSQKSQLKLYDVAAFLVRTGNEAANESSDEG